MKIKLIIIFSIILIGVVFVFIEPIPQPQSYYKFSDNNNYFGINNFWNVISNTPFLLVGLFGLILDKNKKLTHDNYLITPVYSIFFLGIFLTSFGSSWFHLNPSNETLVWDRLPMTIGFMALTTGLLSEYLKRELQQYLLYPLLLIGFTSVIYWHFTEQAGRGDLRLYALVQFLPLLVIPAVVVTHKPRYTCSWDLIWVFIFYILAKVTEHFDHAIHQLLGGVSGHSIKHLLAAAAAYMVLRMLQRRKPV
ncbi:MAG: ceramidase domain-containing protein [Porticoccus sp.]